MHHRDTATSDSGIAELHEFIHAWADAVAANDVDRMERFVTADWTLVDVGGQISVDTFHRIVRDGTLRHDTMTHEVTGTRHLGWKCVLTQLTPRRQAVSS